jgi:ribosomal-protein-alanine N-acetyltransferase
MVGALEITVHMLRTIETQRLLLRPFADGDVDNLHRIQANPDAMRYTFCATSRDESDQRLRAYAKLEEEIGFAPWTVLLRETSHIIGWGGLNVDPFDPGWGVEIAYFFDPEYWGKGYATELVLMSICYGFDHIGLPEIQAFAHPENMASIRVLEKCGFEYVCFEPRLGRNHYTIQREDWRSAAQPAHAADRAFGPHCIGGSF